MPRASSRSSSSERGELVARRRRELLGRRRITPDVGLDHPQLQRDRNQSLLRAVMQVTLEPAALGVAGRDDPLARRLHLGEPGLRLLQQALVLERHRRRRPDGLDHLRILVERRVVDERRDLTALVLDRCAGSVVGDRRHQHWPPGRVDVSTGSSAAGRPARASGRPASVRAPPATPRRASRPDRGRAERGRREPAASEEAGEERRGHDEQRAVGEHDHELRARALEEVARQQPDEHQHARGTRDARHQCPAPGRRGCPPPYGDHSAGDDGENDQQRTLRRVDRAVDRLAREGRATRCPAARRTASR